MTQTTEKLIEQLTMDTKPLKKAPHPYLLCARWLGGLAVYIAALVMAIGMRPDLAHQFDSPLFLAENLSLLLIAVTSALSAALLSYPDMMQKAWLASAPLFSFALFLLVMLLAWVADHPPAPPPQHEMMCTLCITLYALPPAFWIFHSIRKAASTHLRLAGVTASLCAFSLSSLALRLAEETDSVRHLVTWHYIPAFTLSLLGIALGQKFLKW